MAETEKKASKKSWFKGLKAEFRKIIWVDNKTLGKQTVAVVAISAVTCGLITLVDSANRVRQFIDQIRIKVSECQK
jgi:preprotein translocase subunit SecE